MFNFEEELKKFKPSLEVDDIENAVYQEDLTDMTDLLKQVQSCKVLFSRKYRQRSRHRPDGIIDRAI